MWHSHNLQTVHEVNGGLLCPLYIASFPGLPMSNLCSTAIQFLIACSTASDQKLDSGNVYCKWSKTGRWEGLGTRLSLVMVIWLGYSGDAQLELLAGFKSHLRSEVWASCNFLNEHSWTLLIGIPKPNSRCSSLSSVAEVPYMEGFIFICKWKLHVAVERTAWS